MSILPPPFRSQQDVAIAATPTRKTLVSRMFNSRGNGGSDPLVNSVPLIEQSYSMPETTRGEESHLAYSREILRTSSDGMLLAASAGGVVDHERIQLLLDAHRHAVVKEMILLERLKMKSPKSPTFSTISPKAAAALYAEKKKVRETFLRSNSAPNGMYRPPSPPPPASQLKVNRRSFTLRRGSGGSKKKSTLLPLDNDGNFSPTSVNSIKSPNFGVTVAGSESEQMKMQILRTSSWEKEVRRSNSQDSASHSGSNISDFEGFPDVDLPCIC